jgi:hypothetical protein
LPRWDFVAAIASAMIPTTYHIDIPHGNFESGVPLS